LGDNQIREGFVSGFLLILFSELGDKTFFIAVLLAVKYRQSQGLVFAGAFGALAAMTVISVRPPCLCMCTQQCRLLQSCVRACKRAVVHDIC
jgi:putative Ca2+/H+ antiporter (TMEM165/GDT1 family)